MGIGGRVVVGNFAYGNPASLGEPLGLWTGQAQLIGDVSGGNVTLVFVPQNPADTPTLNDQRREFVYFIDNASIVAVGGDPGVMSCQVISHFARSNVSLPRPFSTSIMRMSQNDGTQRMPIGPLVDAQTIRQPLFWDSQELASTSFADQALVILTLATNTAGIFYDFRVYGRYYDRQLVSNRSFGRLVAPPPVAPFD